MKISLPPVFFSWTKYGTRYGSGEDYDEQGQNQDDNDDSGNGCGGFGGEYYWYMGRTQCFKANVAYSLYGVLKNENPTQKDGSYCHKETYINSFFTTFGVESFAGPTGLGVDTANSYCTSSDPGNGGQQAYYDDAKVDDDYLDDSYQFYDYASYESYGTGCSKDGKFVTDMYQGAFCHGHNYVETLDTLDSFNEAMESFECTEIYSASDQQDRNLGDNDDYDFEEMEAVYILSFSKSCSLRQYPNDCPDPYGLKKQYSKKIVGELEYKTGIFRDVGTKLLKACSWLSILGGLYFILAALVVRRRHARRVKRLDKKSKRKRRRSKNKVLKSNADEASSPASTDKASPSSPSNLSNNRSRSYTTETDQGLQTEAHSSADFDNQSAVSDAEPTDTTSSQGRIVVADLVSPPAERKPRFSLRNFSRKRTGQC